MVETTNKALADGQEHWDGIPAFADAVSRMKTGVKAIREKQEKQLPGGETDARDPLEEQMLLIASQVSALAAKLGDAMTAAKVDLEKSQLDRMADSDLVAAAQAVSEAATGHSAKLASDYKITAADLGALETATTTFDGMKTSPRDAVVKRRVETLSLPEAIAFVRGIYRNELDKLMLRFRRSEPGFFAKYFAARVIVEKTGTHESKKKPQQPPGGQVATL